MAIPLPQNLSASGGHASNGDTTQHFNSDFGGINYKTGINPMWVGVGLVAAAIAYMSLKK